MAVIAKPQVAGLPAESLSSAQGRRPASCSPAPSRARPPDVALKGSQHPPPPQGAVVPSWGHRAHGSLQTSELTNRGGT